MKINKNKLGFSILSLALALGLPLNASATEKVTQPENIEITEDNKIDNTEIENTENVEDTEGKALIEEDEILKEDTYIEQTSPSFTQEPSRPAQNRVTTLPTVERNKKERNKNYISQQGIDTKEEKPFELVLKDKIDEEKGLIKEEVDGKIKYSLTYELGIIGDGQTQDYTISLFTIKDDEAKSINLRSYVVDSVAKSSEDKKVREIETDEYKGYKLETTLRDTGYLEFALDLDQDSEPDTHTIYYQVSTPGHKTIGKNDIKIDKNENGDLYIVEEEEKDEKTKLIANKASKSYLINDSEEDKNLLDLMDIEGDLSDAYKLDITYIDPAKGEDRKETIEKIEDYKVPADSVVKISIRENLPVEEIKDDVEEVKEEASGDSVNAPSSFKDLLKEANDSIEDLNKSTNDIKSTILEAEDGLSEENSDGEEKEEASQKKSNPNSEEEKLANEKALEEAMAKVEKLLEEKKRSIIEINPAYDDIEAEALGLSMILREQTRIIEDLIQQALLDNELDSLEELEKKDKEKADAEYKRIRDLVEKAEDVNERAEEKLIELDEINLTDNLTDPLIIKNVGAKPVLNLGRLTPITRIDNLTFDSPNESERDFSKNLERKLARAVEKVETVTIDKEADEKAKELSKDNKKSEKETGDKEGVLEENLEKEEGKDEKSVLEKDGPSSFPLFERYLLRLNKEK
ncbi:hypothetical protein [uncultured Anaerococcus sp.]|uniref:hypothetical protein n=1 Tax=uncultured Anaerococcus sp. TaxID=293428 RepID=UPI0025EB7DB1|nr:hypothetical protein [uncultured Anaerococcus sp.]